MLKLRTLQVSCGVKCLLCPHAAEQAANFDALSLGTAETAAENAVCQAACTWLCHTQCMPPLYIDA